MHLILNWKMNLSSLPLSFLKSKNAANILNVSWVFDYNVLTENVCDDIFYKERRLIETDNRRIPSNDSENSIRNSYNYGFKLENKA